MTTDKDEVTHNIDEQEGARLDCLMSIVLSNENKAAKLLKIEKLFKKAILYTENSDLMDKERFEILLNKTFAVLAIIRDEI